MTRSGLGTAGFLAVCVALLTPFLAGQNAAALVASASALALLTAALLACTKVIVLAATTPADVAACALRSLSRAARVLPQRDPDAAGKPRPRAPGADPATV